MGLYSHVTRAEGTVLTGFGSSSDIFNVDHENHVTHTDPTFINSWEDTLGHMNLETDPAPGGVLSLALAMSNELERLRFALTTIKKAVSSGTAPAHWYIPLGSISEFQAPPPTAARQNITLGTLPSSANSDSPPFPLVGLLPPVYDTTGGKMPGTGLGMSAPVTGVYIVGATILFAVPMIGDLQLIVNRFTPASAVTERIASNENQSGVFSSNKGLTTETVAHFATNQRFLVSALQTSGAPQLIASASMWMALVSRG